jgi:phosphoenolpyruvate carboxylase
MVKRSTTPEELSPALRGVVRAVETTLGQVIAQADGRKVFDAVEAIRLDMAAVRDGQPRRLASARRRLGRLSLTERTLVARAYTVYLELVNVCENAYRTHRLRARWRKASGDGQEAANANVVFVLTAHPTESRSPTNIRLMHRIQAVLVDSLERSDPPDSPRLQHLLHLVWRTGTHPAHKPTVEDEALHLFSLISNPILDELLQLRREGHVVRLRTWVGGDKDGHPGVGPEETDRSCNLSRARLLDFVNNHLLPSVEQDVLVIHAPDVVDAWAQLRAALDGVRVLTIGDGRRMSLLRDALSRLSTVYTRRHGHLHPRLDDLRLLLDQFPGLIVPLELREERGLFRRDGTIAAMLSYLRDVARGGRVDWYVRGCVVSMASCAEDLWEAHALVDDVVGASAMPVVPLFEMPHILPQAADILERALGHAGFLASIRDHGCLEVMLGYSDTSKRMGVLASRVAIHDAMTRIGGWAERRGIRVLFFHGSGGSVGRGGGSIADQAASWPASAMDVVKQTLQGEMVERTLATPEILRSQIHQIAAVQAAPPRFRAPGQAAQDLATRSRQAYVELVGSTEFLSLLRAATPYARLGALNIGSRPSKRAHGDTPAGLEQLRAIPWVLCWTQTRYLLHAWLGVGTAWRAVRADPAARKRLLLALKRDPLLRGYLRLLRFTLAKTAPAIWRRYVTSLTGTPSALVKRLEQEWEDARDLAQQLTPGDALLADRPWLAESIYYRAPMIHPLNLIQIEVLTRQRLNAAEELLFRETVTGIAAGMLTTG